MYQRASNGASIASPGSFTVSMDEYIGAGYDSGCNTGTATKTFYQRMPYWGLAFLNKDRSDDEWYVTQYTGNDLEVLNATNPMIIISISASSTAQ